MEKSSGKGKLTDQQLQQLSSLIDQAQTLRPEAEKAGVESQLDKVLSRLNMMRTF